MSIARQGLCQATLLLKSCDGYVNFEGLEPLGEKYLDSMYTVLRKTHPKPSLGPVPGIAIPLAFQMLRLTKQSIPLRMTTVSTASELSEPSLSILASKHAEGELAT